MIKNYIVTNVAGEILRSGICPDEMFFLQAEPGEVIVEGVADSEQHYFEDGVRNDRPTMPLVIPETTFTVGNIFTVAGIPAGTEVRCSTGSIVVDDGFFEWSSATPGPETFTLTNFPYKDEVIHVNVTDA